MYVSTHHIGFDRWILCLLHHSIYRTGGYTFCVLHASRQWLLSLYSCGNVQLSGGGRYTAKHDDHAYATERIEEYIGAGDKCNVRLMIQNYDVVGGLGYVMREGRPLWAVRADAPFETKRTVMLLACGGESPAWLGWTGLGMWLACAEIEGVPRLTESPPPSVAHHH